MRSKPIANGQRGAATLGRGSIAIRLPETFRTNPYADGFAIFVKREP